MSVTASCVSLSEEWICIGHANGSCSGWGWATQTAIQRKVPIRHQYHSGTVEFICVTMEKFLVSWRAGELVIYDLLAQRCLAQIDTGDEAVIKVRDNLIAMQEEDHLQVLQVQEDQVETMTQFPRNTRSLLHLGPGWMFLFSPVASSVVQFDYVTHQVLNRVQLPFMTSPVHRSVFCSSSPKRAVVVCDYDEHYGRNTVRTSQCNKLVYQWQGALIRKGVVSFRVIALVDAANQVHILTL